MLIFKLLCWTLYGVSMLSTIASLVKWDHWWVRMFDFPRIQIVAIHFLSLLFGLLIVWPDDRWSLLFVASLLISMAYQMSKIYPYTPFSKKEVSRCMETADQNEISLMVSNVLTPNRQADKLLKLVYRYQPDILLTLESDQWWQDQLSVLEQAYPHTVKIPLDNLYGMHLYSKLNLTETKVLYLVEEDIPSIHSLVTLRSGEKIEIHCLHPEPPSPTESETSTSRDAELLIVGKNVKQSSCPVIVLGDLNDVAWSRTTKLFQKISGLLDPRIGRGFFNTFHAGYWFLRWPLDHVFISKEFLLRTIKVLPSIGSDHFPVFMHLHLNPPKAHLNDSQQAPPDREEKDWADEKIENADPKIRVF
ncbi:MAG: endonuclease/exonuclease/phosphatase family protein [Lunatimonas sp.]|uniref:endonuclease/exonuclease/phosphatase family protein n=1 Tax=Lunatimonas sp. TaxID=2060141 RepID=UPI00263BB9C5|nr:endonuclease/exonuclease/phosphatase family protein [Lunatimonas sp.]MCC5937467.1 endonuclease/exonuclease/phosphatase family protein [Lunatimonas sp.]